jgi:AraC family transcriptional regulator
VPRRTPAASVARGHRLEYEQRVNRVVDHITRHLGDPLTLPELARVAAFSPYHFHRVFGALAGETLFGFVQRLRLERAAAILRDRRDQSVLSAALDSGFGSAATFARAFRARFGMSATEWRAGGAARWTRRRVPASNPGKQVRKAGKAAARGGGHTARREKRKEAPMPIQIRELPPHQVAYMRYIGPYGSDGIPELWTRVLRWMRTRNLTVASTVRLGVGHDDPSITAPGRCRYDACVVVPHDFAPDRWVTLGAVAGGTHAVARFTGGPGEIAPAWEHVFRAWLPDSGYQPDDRPGIEVYRGDPTVPGRPGRFRCDLCLPVRPL